MKAICNELQEAGFKKILVLGSPGSGKTTLSKRISSFLNIPLIKMDDLYWKAGWERPIEHDFLTLLEQVVNQEQWVLDGNYYRYLYQRIHFAQAIVFLDVRSSKCLWRVFKRFTIRVLGNRISLPFEVSNETGYKFRLKVAVKLLKNILSFQRRTKPKMLDIITKSGKPLYIINNFKG